MAYPQPNEPPANRDARHNRNTLTRLLEQKAITPGNIPEALKTAQLYPTPGQWQSFTHNLLLWFSVFALSFGTLFFVAANWDVMGRIIKFGLLQLLVIISVTSYCYFYQRENLRKASLLAGMFFVGVLMAYFGQTYQTGADPWQLFFNWALLTTPWVLVSRWVVSWLFWLALLNLALSLFLGLSRLNEQYLLVMFCFSTLALTLWQFSSRHFTWLNKPWAIGLLAVLSCYFGTLMFIEALFDKGPPIEVLYLAWLGLVFFYYRKINLNIFIMTLWCFSIVVAGNSVFIRIFEGINEGLVLLMAMFTLGGGTYFVIWLKKLLKESQS